MRGEDRAGGDAGFEAVELGDGERPRSDRQRAQDARPSATTAAACRRRRRRGTPSPPAAGSASSRPARRSMMSSLTTRSCARNSPMQTSAVGEAAPPSRVVKLFERRRQLQPAQADGKAGNRRDQQRVAQQREQTPCAPVRPEAAALLQVDLDDNDREQEQHAGGEQSGDDRRRAGCPGRTPEGTSECP